MIRSTEHLRVLNEIARIATLDLELRPMLQRITDALSREFDWEFVACISIDSIVGRFVCEAVSGTVETEVVPGYSRELGSGVVGEVALTGKAILLDEVKGHPNYVETLPGARSELCIPVRHQGETVALLNLESRIAGAFREQRQLLETVAEQIAGAIANARLHAELTRRAELLEMVGEVSKVATDAGELRLLMEQVVSYIRDRFPLSVVAIMLADMKEGKITQSAFAGKVRRNYQVGAQWGIDRGVVGRALRLGTAQLVPEVRADPDYIEVADDIRAEFAVPIRFRDRLLGVLNLEAASSDVFNPEHQTVFRTFADQLGGAIHMATINQALEDANDLLREANQRLERLSQLDGLTGIQNRRTFDHQLRLEARRAARGEVPLAVLMIDIDCFKDYNDHYGHLKGDECLRTVARALREGLHRAGDFVARYGGEEFGVLLPGEDVEHATRVAESLRARIEAMAIPHSTSRVGSVVTISAGVASAVPEREAGPDWLVEAADKALYEAKRQGRNRVVTAE
jgi:diguanylate cyclase (GGDEF)-like protein